MPKIVQTPGTVLKSLLDEYQLTPAKLAQAIGLSNSAVYQISTGKTRVSVPVALRFAKYFGQTPAYWLDLQNAADLAESAKDVKLTAVIKAISKVKKPTKAAIAKAEKILAGKVKTAKPGKPSPAKTVKAKAPAKKTAKAAAANKASAKKAAIKKTSIRNAAPTTVKAAAPKKVVKPRAKKVVKNVTPPPASAPFKPDTILIKKEDIPPFSQADTEN